MQGMLTSKVQYVQRLRLQGKRLKIIGFGNLFKLKNSKWKVKVFLLNEQDEVEQIDFLFSNIGDLRLGQIFDDGFPKMPAIESEREFILPPFKKWRVEKISDWLKVCPFFHGQSELISQNLFVFTLGKETVFIPQIELAKILFFKKAILTRYVFQSNGLKLFAYDEEKSKNEIKITFLPDVPMNILDDSSLLNHLSWIYNQPNILDSFASCFNKMSKQNNARNSQSKKFSFEFDPPDLENVVMKARCSVKLWGHVFVEEILGLEALPMPQTDTVFIHPHANRYKKAGGSNGSTTTKASVYDSYSDYGVNIDSDDTGESKNLLYVDTAQVQLSYSHPAIYRIDRNVMPIGDINKNGAYPAPVNACTDGGFDESVAGGKQKQLELDSISNPELINFNLDRFVEEISEICELNQWEKIYKAIFLPRIGRHRFHLIGECTRQAILIIIKTNKHFCYLVEVQTDDNKALSTLVFKRQSNLEKEERNKFLNELIVKLIKASGHWTNKDIDATLINYQFSDCIRFKHAPRAVDSDKVKVRNESWKQRLTKWVME